MYECCQVNVIDEMMIEIVAVGSLNLSDEGRHCEDEFVNENVKLKIKEVK